MLRGNHPAKIDEKGRLKVPTAFRTFIESEWKSAAVYVTCDDSAGQYVRVYPMPVWVGVEERLSKMPSTADASSAGRNCTDSPRRSTGKAAY